MAISDILGNAPLWDFIKDQNLREIITRKEFRVTEEYLNRELVTRVGSDKVKELSLKIYDGHAEVTGKLKQWPMPMSVPFLVRFELLGFEFNRNSRFVRLKVDLARPAGGDFFIGKLAEKIAFLTYEKGIATCDLAKVPLLSGLFGYHLKGTPVIDFVTIKELTLNKGEIVGKLGVSL